jgi:hypothetical protein
MSASLRLIAAALTVAGFASTGLAQVKLSTLKDLTYAQTFDQLPAPAEQSPWEWANDGKQTRYGMDGWYLATVTGAAAKPLAGATAYVSSAGKFPTVVATVNYGLAGAADRAIGFRFGGKAEANGATKFYAGVVFVNDTKQPIGRVEIAYQGEQWVKYGGNVETLQTLRVAIANLGPKFPADKFAVHRVAPVAEVGSLEFRSQDDATGVTRHATKGPVHVAPIVGAIAFPRPLGPGEHFLLLWTATGNGTENGAHSLALDDVKVRFEPAR